MPLIGPELRVCCGPSPPMMARCHAAMYRRHQSQIAKRMLSLGFLLEPWPFACHACLLSPPSPPSTPSTFAQFNTFAFSRHAKAQRRARRGYMATCMACAKDASQASQQPPRTVVGWQGLAPAASKYPKYTPPSPAQASWDPTHLLMLSVPGARSRTRLALSWNEHSKVGMVAFPGHRFNSSFRSIQRENHAKVQTVVYRESSYQKRSNVAFVAGCWYRIFLRGAVAQD